jgi:hypothetical protein
MRKLIKHTLEFNKTLEYFLEYLEERHKLSDTLLKYHDFTQGSFYTLLTKDANIAKLYQFNIGGILPHNHTHEIYIESLGKSFQGEIVNNLDIELSQFIYSTLRTNKNLAFLMEELILSLMDKHIDLYNVIGKHFENELFYLISQNNLTKSLVTQSIKECSYAWHFVSVLFEQKKMNFTKKEIKHEDFLQICSKVSFVIVGAYDGEGYVFWEKK